MVLELSVAISEWSGMARISDSPKYESDSVYTVGSQWAVLRSR